MTIIKGKGFLFSLDIALELLLEYEYYIRFLNKLKSDLCRC